MSEHLLLFPDRDVADDIAEELGDEGFAEVRVLRVAHAGEDDAEDHEWGVYVREGEGDGGDADDAGPVVDGLRGRFEALARKYDGWYDPEPTTP